MKRKNAFTLVELLVVISIIALLLSILMPSLQKAREMGKRIVCLQNLKQMTLGWMLYAESNDDKLVNTATTDIRDLGGSPRQFGWRAGGTPTWVGWWTGGPTLPAGHDPVLWNDIEAREAAIKIGLLYPYCQILESYRCPTGRRGEVLTYAAVDPMNGTNYGTMFTRLTKIPRPSDRMVFVDEGMATNGTWSVFPPEWGLLQWWDPVPVRHGKGATFSFADGHSEYWKWKDDRTLDYSLEYNSEWRYGFDHIQPDNPDLRRVQKAVWGKSAE